MTPDTGPMGTGTAAICVVLKRGGDFETAQQTAQLKATCKTVLEVCVHKASQFFHKVLAAAWRRRQERQQAQSTANTQSHRCILPIVSVDIWNAL